jgi:RND superfamily putative drug exporter
MHLLGDRAWYLPRWLDRLLPDLDVEGVKLAERLESGALGGVPTVSETKPETETEAEAETHPTPSKV